MRSNLGLDPDVLASIGRRQLSMIYHFISISYLPNIVVRDGLWCRRRLTEWNDSFDSNPLKWGNPAKAEAFGSYVSCSVNPPMGMLTRRTRPVLLQIDASTAARRGVLFIGRWSSFGGVTADSAVLQTGQVWFDGMFLNRNTSRAEPHPGEMLVPEHIPLKSIVRLVFFTEDDRTEAKSLLAGISLPPGVQGLYGTVNATLFGNKMQGELA